METIEIKNMAWEILYSHKQENNSIKITLEKAVKEEIELTGAYLGRADLLRANLKWANLEEAYLRWANLEGAVLERANLEDANLRDVYIENAELEWANLQWASLRDASYLTYSMLKQVRSLYNTIGIDEFHEVLMEHHPTLFEFDY